jgi:hypothetical protein
LQGDGITILLDGHTQIKKGITYSNFDSIPDAPVTSFETILPEGRYSVLGANTNLCDPTKTETVKERVAVKRHGKTVKVTRKVSKTVAEPLVIPTFLEGQNGAQIHQSTKVSVVGCPKVKTAKKASVSKHATKKAH